jgi:hypothetical protein
MFALRTVYSGSQVPRHLTWIQTAYGKSESDCPIIDALVRQPAASLILWSVRLRQKFEPDLILFTQAIRRK